MKRMIISFVCCLFAMCGPAGADAPKPFPDFTFKRVKPPSTSQGPRITVQIGPKTGEPDPGSAHSPLQSPKIKRIGFGHKSHLILDRPAQAGLRGRLTTYRPPQPIR